ncbi:class I SAM-dependent methyltransferase [Exiguobacterium sp. MMG028]|uniref:class I SAM-dependent methyltransferase n=1 Tax=Exiguobacterium sp. MMG028 TaxID=3021979 RepID=UPI0022FE4011|nr:class I SAM-dependent methyltransferase [Exiguobacterium sp. MMG028]MDA5560883.1 class I SAM-dependent methyltransferase [Exiguobacterium sp. MMG028]
MLPQVFKNWVDSQYENPRGPVGKYIGEKMVRQHRIEVEWTIEQLHMHANATVLELGCGAGDALSTILQKREDVNVIGLDRSKTLIASAKKRNAVSIQRRRARLMEGDFHQLAMTDASIDHVFSIHTLYFWEDVTTILSEIERVLKPNGTFIITYCDGKGDVQWDGIAKMIHEEFIPKATNLGFQGVSIRRGPDSRDYRTVAVIGRKSG